MKILHTSDLHGDYKLPMRNDDFDVWVDTGDFFPNLTRGEFIEPRWQHDWFTMTKLPLRKRYMGWLRKHYAGKGYPASQWYPSDSRQPRGSRSVAEQLVKWLRGRPVVCVPGNHDWQSLCGLLKAGGYDRAWDITQGPIELGGYKWAGFREIPFITGEWMGEVGSYGNQSPFQYIVPMTIRSEPNILLTHAPPAGLLDKTRQAEGKGIEPLTQWLAYQPHDVKLHLFGHVHEQGGRCVQEMGITFCNSANTAQIVEII
jgi:Icc-related predicted phosphoesterase